MAVFNPDRIRMEEGLVIREKIIPWGAVWPRTVYGRDAVVKFSKGSPYKADRKLSGGTGRVEYITIHNTGTIQTPPGITMAQRYAQAFWPDGQMNDRRVHYLIDAEDCWQLLREDEVGRHADDSRGPGNETSLGVVCIMNAADRAWNEETEARGAKLAAILLRRHGLSVHRLTTHNRWYGQQNCPAYILPHWETFRQRVAEELTALVDGQITAEEPSATRVFPILYPNLRSIPVRNTGRTDTPSPEDQTDAPSSNGRKGAISPGSRTGAPSPGGRTDASSPGGQADAFSSAAWEERAEDPLWGQRQKAAARWDSHLQGWLFHGGGK